MKSIFSQASYLSSPRTAPIPRPVRAIRSIHNATTRYAKHAEDKASELAQDVQALRTEVEHYKARLATIFRQQEEKDKKSNRELWKQGEETSKWLRKISEEMDKNKAARKLAGEQRRLQVYWGDKWQAAFRDRLKIVSEVSWGPSC